MLQFIWTYKNKCKFNERTKCSSKIGYFYFILLFSIYKKIKYILQYLRTKHIRNIGLFLIEPPSYTIIRWCFWISWCILVSLGFTTGPTVKDKQLCVCHLWYQKQSKFTLENDLVQLMIAMCYPFGLNVLSRNHDAVILYYKFHLNTIAAIVFHYIFYVFQ